MMPAGGLGVCRPPRSRFAALLSNDSPVLSGIGFWLGFSS